MLYQIRHLTTYRYEADVTLSHHMLRLTPRDLPRQRRLFHELTINPMPAAIHRHEDYYGNTLAALTLEAGHNTFAVDACSQVEVFTVELPEPESTSPWDQVAVSPNTNTGPEDLDCPAAEEFLFDSPLIQRRASLADYAWPSFEPERPILDSVLDLTARIFEDFKFDPKATTVATPLEEVLRLRRGVCQDFAQLQIGCLRSIGIAARYVSGYLETLPPPGKPKLVGADASHAWLAFFCPGHGWIDVDPTNNLLPSHRHITVAWGRDYSDVSPIRGVVLGSGNHDLDVSVDVSPFSPAP